MKLTESLMIEHHVFSEQFQHLEEALRHPEQYPDAVIRAIVEALAISIERHARTEDDVLFPALETYLERTSGPLAVLEAEHEKIRGAMATITAGQDIRGQTTRLIEILRQHIHKEDRVLFPMAEEFLGPENLTRLAQACHMGASPGWSTS